MIVYPSFIRNAEVVTELFGHLTVEKCDASFLLTVLLAHLAVTGVDIMKLSGISTDGASVMRGSQAGVATQLKLRVPHLVTCHCIAHREALAAKDAAEAVPDLNMVDTVVWSVAENLGRSIVLHSQFMELQHILHETSLEVQGFKDVRWLARGDAIWRLVTVLPAALVVLWEHDKKAYATVTSFKFHFFLFFLADVLKLLNDLNLKFQRRTVDITRVASMVHNTCDKLRQQYIEHGVNYAEDSELLTEFLDKHGPLNKREVTAKGMDGEGSPVTHTFMLHEDAIKGQKSKGDIESCITVTSRFAQEVVKHLLKWMESLDTLSGAKLFLPDAYAEGSAKRDRLCAAWFQSLRELFSAEKCVLPGRCVSMECINVTHSVLCSQRLTSPSPPLVLASVRVQE
ncbi:unnamed protein product [Closterium sp. NIES-53]